MISVDHVTLVREPNSCVSMCFKRLFVVDVCLQYFSGWLVFGCHGDLSNILLAPEWMSHSHITVTMRYVAWIFDEFAVPT